jgi:Ca2+-binding RTX toxin-like protein
VAGFLIAGQAVLIADPAFAAARVSVSGSQITYAGNRLTAVKLTITASGGYYKFVDTAGNLSVGSGCSLLSPTEVWCNTAGVSLFEVTSGSAADTVTNRTSVRMNASTGTGNDTINAGTGGGTITPGPGNDTVNGNSGSDAFVDAIDVNGDADVYLGLGGTDSLSYAEAPSGVVVTKDGNSDDGVPGEGDLAYVDIEWMYGSLSGDNLNGTSGTDYFQGFGGDDSINGGAGKDFLYGGAGQDTLFGGDGDDVLSDLDGARDTLNGGNNRDTCQGDAIDARSSCEVEA